MKRMFAIAMVLFAVVAMMSGCAAGWQEYMSRTQVPNINSVSTTRYVSEDYEVLGPVEATGSSKSILGMVVEGKDGQGLLMKEAMDEYRGECTGIKDITAYKEYNAILPIIFNEINTTYMGVAIKE